MKKYVTTLCVLCCATHLALAQRPEATHDTYMWLHDEYMASHYSMSPTLPFTVTRRTDYDRWWDTPSRLWIYVAPGYDAHYRPEYERGITYSHYWFDVDIDRPFPVCTFQSARAFGGRVRNTALWSSATVVPTDSSFRLQYRFDTELQHHEAGIPKQINGAYVYGLTSLTRGPTGYEPVPPSTEYWTRCMYCIGRFDLDFSIADRAGAHLISLVRATAAMTGLENGEYELTENHNEIIAGNRWGPSIVAWVVLQRFGDANLDGRVDGLDLADFLQALDTPALYWAHHLGAAPALNCDVNHDGLVDGRDIEPFIEAVKSGGVEGDYWDGLRKRKGK